MRNKKGLSFVTIMIIIALSALGLRIMIEQVMRMTVAQNESSALASLKLISTAIENYAKDSQGNFPSNLTVLTKTSPPYLDQDYIAKSSIKGYSYSCTQFGVSGYSCSASPVKCGITGKLAYTITTGGALASDDCAKRE